MVAREPNRRSAVEGTHVAVLRLVKPVSPAWMVPAP